ncbi:MAG: DUF4199 domain-containing protein [Bacteroidales bacterium]|nr:DUF4199 domain-containing protein [Bacteroidales bacterium]
MTIKMNPVGASLNEYLMKMALPLGGYFIIEYLVRNYSASNIFLSLLTFPMMLITVFLVYWIMKRMRDKLLNGKISGFMAWTFGTQLMLFAGLLEAAFIYIYNEFVVPTNLLDMQTQMIAQYEDVMKTIEAMPEKSELLNSANTMMQDTINVLKETPVSSPIEAAMSMLSNDIFFGMLMMLFIAPIIRKN